MLRLSLRQKRTNRAIIHQRNDWIGGVVGVVVTGVIMTTDVDSNVVLVMPQRVQAVSQHACGTISQQQQGCQNALPAMRSCEFHRCGSRKKLYDANKQDY